MFTLGAQLAAWWPLCHVRPKDALHHVSDGFEAVASIQSRDFDLNVLLSSFWPSWSCRVAGWWEWRGDRGLCLLQGAVVPAGFPWGHLLAARFLGTPSYQSRVFAAHRKPGVLAAGDLRRRPEGEVRTRPSSLMRTSRAGRASAEAVGWADSTVITSRAVSSRPVRGQESSLDRSQSATAGGAFPSSPGALGRRGHAINDLLGLRGSHESVGKGSASRKPVSLSTRNGGVPSGLLSSGGEYSPGLRWSRIWTLSPKPRMVLHSSPSHHTSGAGRQGLRQHL